MAVKSVKVKNVAKTLEKIDNLLTQSIKSKKVLRATGEFVTDRIYKFTKAGKSLVYGGAKLRPLYPLYVEQRKLYSKAGGTKGRLFSPGRSNLTLTGQMLDALTYMLRTRGTNTEIEVFVKSTRRKPSPTGNEFIDTTENLS